MTDKMTRRFLTVSMAMAAVIGVLAGCGGGGSGGGSGIVGAIVTPTPAPTPDSPTNDPVTDTLVSPDGSKAILTRIHRGGVGTEAGRFDLYLKPANSATETLMATSAGTGAWSGDSTKYAHMTSAAVKTESGFTIIEFDGDRIARRVNSTEYTDPLHTGIFQGNVVPLGFGEYDRFIFKVRHWDNTNEKYYYLNMKTAVYQVWHTDYRLYNPSPGIAGAPTL